MLETFYTGEYADSPIRLILTNCIERVTGA